MPTVLQNIGASRAGTSLTNYITQQRELANRTNLAEARTSQLKSSDEMSRIQIENARRQRKEDETPIAWQAFSDTIKVPAIKDYMEKVARANALVGDDGIITKKNLGQLRELMKMDMHTVNASEMKREHVQGEYDALIKAKKDRSGKLVKEMGIDPKELDTLIKQKGIELGSVLGKNKGYMEHVKAKYQQKQLTQQKEIADADRQSRERNVDVRAQASKDAAGIRAATKETPEEKSARELALFKLKAKWKNANPELLKPNDRRILDKDLTTMAITLDNDPAGPGTKQAAKFFNDYATGTSVYLWKKTKRRFLGDKEETIKIDLPIFNGIQVTASDIRATLNSPQGKGKTLEDILIGIGAIEATK